MQPCICALDSTDGAEGGRGAHSVSLVMKRDGVLVVQDRIRGCLKGVATGDAVGKQTEGLSHDDVRRWYPHGIRGFEGEPGSVIPRYAGNQKRKWQVGETTDDTERTIAVARAIVRDGEVCHESVGRELLKCRKCVHPGVASLWEFHEAADPARVAERHDGCGAAVRVAPVGILYRSERQDEIVSAAREASISTHGGSLAIAGAAATAAAVSAAIDGALPAEIIDAACQAVARVERQWPGAGGHTFAQAVHQVHQDLFHRKDPTPAVVAAMHFPDHPLTIVPLALALGAVMPSVEAGILFAANVGGDSDSVASIAGAILGARNPESVNEEWHLVVERINGHNLTSLAEELGALRS
jgi:ADP-ribosylglycohydrolase